MSKYLIVLDLDRIKEYVFGTGRLKEITGASAILNEFYDKDNIESLIKEFDCKLIYSAGGTTLLFGNDESRIQAMIKKIKSNFLKNTISSTISAAYIEIDDNTRLFEDDISSKVEELFIKLRFEKSAKNTYPTISSPVFKLCDSCGKYPATKNSSKGEKVILICDSCNHKAEKSKNSKKGLWTDFINYCDVHNHSISFEVANEFTNLCEGPADGRDGTQEKTKGYMGLLYGDGNGMGTIIKKHLKTGNDMLEFSKLVDRALKESAFETAYSLFCANNQGGKYFPANFLILGGDDLIVAVRGREALEMAAGISKLFNEKTKKFFAESNVENLKNINAGNGLHMSIGVALAHPSYPFSSLLDHCEQLLKSSKKPSYEKAGGYIDFSIITSGSVNELENIRNEEYTQRYDNKKQMFIKTMRPYSVDGLNNLIITAKKIKKEKFSSKKIMQFAESLFENQNNSQLEAQYIFSKLSLSHKNIIDNFCSNAGIKLEYMPWKEHQEKNLKNFTKFYNSPFLDLMDVYRILNN